MKYLSKITISCAVLMMLALAGCSNVFSPPMSAGNKAAGLTIAISNDPNARTLYPHAVFTKYVLDFDGPGGDTFQEILENGQSSITISDLAPGEWTITATGWVTIKNPLTQEENDYPAADGSTQVTITGASQNIGITISSYNTGDDGFFSYSVDFPSEMVDDAYLEIRGFHYYQYEYEYKDLFDEPEGLIQLPPGYYIMQIQMHNDYQSIGRTEVVHIYSNMETKADFTFSPGDFTQTIKLSGTLDVTVNDIPPEYINTYLYVYRDPYRNESLGSGYVSYDSESNKRAWSFTMLPFDTPETAYFFVEYWTDSNIYGYKPIGTQEVWNQSISGIDFAPLNTSYIALSGTMDITVYGSIPDYIQMEAYRDPNGYNLMGYASASYDSGEGVWSWSIQIESLDAPETVYFYVYYVIYDLSVYGSKPAGTQLAGNQDISGIDLEPINITRISLSGTMDFTVNGSIPDYIEINAYRDSNGNNGIGYAHPSYDYDEGVWSWSMQIESLDATETVYFYVYYELYYLGISETKLLGTHQVYNEDIDNIDFALNVTRIQLGGTIDITRNGQVPNEIYIWVYLDPNHDDYLNGFWADYDSNTDSFYWRYIIDSLDEPANLYLELMYRIYGYGDYYCSFEIPDVKDQDILDCDIIKRFATAAIGGTANITVDGKVPDSMWLEAYEDADFQNYIGDSGCRILFDKNKNEYCWSMDIDESYIGETLHLAIWYWCEGDYGDTMAFLDPIYIQPGVENYNIVKAINTVTLSGTANIGILVNNVPNTSDGEVYIGAYLDPEFNSYIAWGTFNQSTGTWTMQVPSLNPPRSLYFAVQVNFCGNYGNDQSAASVSVGSSAVSNINLGSFSFEYEGIILSGTVEIIVDGKEQHSGNWVMANPGNYNTTIKNDNSWAMLIEPFSSPTNLDFYVDWYEEDYGWTTENTGIIIQVYNTGISGIDLGRHEFFTSGYGGRSMLLNATAANQPAAQKKGKLQPGFKSGKLIK